MERWIGKVAVVTGASIGIGANISLTLAKHGMTVVALARSEDKLKSVAAASNGNVHPIRCDVTNEREVISVFKQVEDKFGGVDLLVNNAAFLAFSPLTEGSLDEWRAILETNVLAVSVCSREALKTMKNRDGQGHIVNINSIAGHHITHAFNESVGMYPTSKFALSGLTKSLRRELKNGKYNVKITNLSPGLIHTNMGQQVCDHLKIPLDNSQEVPYGNLIPQDVTDVLISVISLNPRVEVHDVIFQNCDVDF